MKGKNGAIWMFIAITLPLFIFISLYQSSRFENLKKEVAELDEQQHEWFEENRKLVSSIAIYNSPTRISQLAKGKLLLSKDEERDIIKIIVQD